MNETAVLSTEENCCNGHAAPSSSVMLLFSRQNDSESALFLYVDDTVGGCATRKVCRLENVCLANRPSYLTTAEAPASLNVGSPSPQLKRQIRGKWRWFHSRIY